MTMLAPTNFGKWVAEMIGTGRTKVLSVHKFRRNARAEERRLQVALREAWERTPDVPWVYVDDACRLLSYRLGDTWDPNCTLRTGHDGLCAPACIRCGRSTARSVVPPMCKECARATGCDDGALVVEDDR